MGGVFASYKEGMRLFAMIGRDQTNECMSINARSLDI